MARLSWIATVPSLLAIAASQPALAGESPPVGLDEARRQLYAEAIQALEKGDWATCRVRALGVWTQKQHPQVAGLLGVCEEKLGLYQDAAEHLAYNRKLDDRASASRTQQVEDAWNRLKPKIAILQVNCNAPGSELAVNGKVVGSAPLTIYLAPGTASLRIRADGYRTETVSLTVTAGEQRPLTVSLKPEGAGKPIWPPILLGIVGAAGIGTGIGLIVLAKSKIEGFDGVTCPGGADTCPTEVQDAADTHNAFLGGGITALVAGTLAAAGIGIYYAVPGGESKAGSIRVTPIFAGTFTGLFVNGAF